VNGPFRFVLMVSPDELEAFVYAVEAAEYRGHPRPKRAQVAMIRKVVARARATMSFLPVCAVCGCTDEHACEGGCAWIAPNLCSKCFKPDEKRPARARKKSR
jgi:hypothetical protein